MTKEEIDNIKYERCLEAALYYSQFKEVTKRKILSFRISALRVRGSKPLAVTKCNTLPINVLHFFYTKISFVISPKRQGKRQVCL